LSELSALLDVDRPDWRSNTIILMDNASYNRNDVIEKHIKRLGLRVIFSAPYSYDASPIEYLFGYFKQGLLM
jgi:transposase